MKILIRFAPWVVFTVVSRVADWRVGVAAGLAALVAVVLTSRPLRVGVLDAGLFAFFAAAGVVALVAPDARLEPVLHPALAAWMCAVAGVSLLAGHPFTLDIARDQVPPDVAASSAFAAVNRSITARWAWTLGAIAVVSTIAEIVDRPVLGTVATIVLLVGAIKASEAPHGDRRPAVGAA